MLEPTPLGDYKPKFDPAESGDSERGLAFIVSSSDENVVLESDKQSNRIYKPEFGSKACHFVLNAAKDEKPKFDAYCSYK